MRRFATPPVVSILLSISVVLAGCLPQRVVIDLKAGGASLKEGTVLADPGTGDSKVALINVTGFIIDAGLPGLFGSAPNPVDELVSRLERAEKDGTVKAVVLRINSPGGTVTGSDTMAMEVRRFSARTGKPVVASLGEVAASGGFYLACACDRIVTQPTTVTASIGVVMQTFNVSETMRMIGVKGRAITSGPNKDFANPFAQEREEHYVLLQNMIDEFYARFRGWVVERRPEIIPSEVGWLTDGRVVTGAAAVKHGLADEEGGVREAFAAAKKLARLERAKLVTYHPDTVSPRSVYASSEAPQARADGLGGFGGASGTGEREINLLQLNMPGGWPGGQAPVGFYYLWMPPG